MEDGDSTCVETNLEQLYTNAVSHRYGFTTSKPHHAVWKCVHGFVSARKSKSWWHFVLNLPFLIEQCKFLAKIVTVLKSTVSLFTRQMKPYRFENAPLLAAFSNRSGVGNGFDRCRVRQRLHEHGFIWDRFVFDAVTPSVYTTPIETVAETVSIWNLYQKWSVFKTTRFHLSCKQRNRIDLNTVSILARNLHCSIQNVKLARSAALRCRLYHHDLEFLAKTDPCKHLQTSSILTQFRSHETVSMWNRVRVNAALLRIHLR